MVRSLFRSSPATSRRRQADGRNWGAASTVEALECRVVPTSVVSIQVDPPSVGPLDVDSLTYTVQFVGPVSGVTTDDFQVVTTGSVQTGSMELIPVTTSTYRVAINGLSGSGEIRLDLIDDGTIFDTSFPLGPTVAPFDGSFQGETFQLNGLYPLVLSINRANPATATTDQTTLQWNVLFNRGVTGVDPSDFFLTFGGSVATTDPIQVSGSDNFYTVTVTGITGTGDVRLNLADDGSIRGLNGNPLMTSSYSPAYDFMGSIVAGPQIDSVNLVDLDGDGDLDYVYGLPATNQVGVVLGTTNFTAQGPAQAYPAGGSPQAILVQDLNGDGLVDVVTANQTGNTISILRGNGNGTFQAPLTITVGSAPTALAAGDVDGDGFPELVVALQGSNSVALLRNNGNDFSFGGTLEVGAAPSSVAMGDVTGDGRIDIVVANRDNNTVMVLSRSGGNGPFNPLPLLNVGTAPVSLELHDLDQDGNLDIVTANSGSNDVTVVLSLGVDGFDTPVTYAAGTQPSAIAAGDVNGDGIPDLLVANQGGGNVSLLQGIGDGTFQAPQNSATSLNPNAIALGDINRDGRVDFITSTLNGGGPGGVHINRNSQTGTFVGQTYTIVTTGPIISSPDTVSVLEAVPASQFPLDVDASEAGNASVTLTYALSGPDQASFTINSSTGQIAFLTIPDFEAPTDTDGDNVYLVTVTVDDGLGHTATQNITINVFPLDEFHLTTNIPSSLSVNENTPGGTLIFDVDADDADQPLPTFQYLLFGPDSAFFNLNFATGELTLVGSPDFENPQDQNGDNVYQITIRVNGQGEDFEVASVAVQIQPLNDNSPVITSPNAAVWDENTPTNTVVLDVDATDADLPAQTLTYSLAGADAGRFTIDPATGEIRFANSPDFEVPGDFNSDNIYNLRVTVSDGFGATANQNVTITVLPIDDNPVIFSSVAVVVVNENFPAGNVVVDVDATDADLPAQTLSYFLGGADASQFTIDSATGEVRFISSPDFEAPTDLDGDNVYQLLISTQAGNFNSGSQALTITVLPVNDNMPVITTTNAITVEENTSVGTVILDADAMDADLPAETLSFALGGPDAARFNINPVTGEIRFNSVPDFEAPADADGNNVYQVVILVSDGVGGNIGQQNVAVTILDLNDVPATFLTPNAVSVDENFSTSDVVLDVDAVDNNTQPSTLVYRLSGPDSTLFDIDSATGEIRFIDSPDFEAPADLDANNVYELTVSVGDNDSTFGSQDLTITVLPVNDNVPQTTSPTEFVVSENTPASAVAADIDATDADLPAQTLNYVLSGPDAALFSIDAATGEIRFLASPNFEIPTDQDGDGFYDVTVKVNDGLGLSTSQNVRIFVANQIEPAIGLPASVTLLEDASISGQLQIGSVDAVGEVFFNIVTPPQHGTVTLDPSLGNYTYTPDADYNGSDSFVFELIQNGLSGPPATVDITITPVNDAPVFTAGSNQTVLEDAGSLVIPGWATGIAAGPATAVDEAGQALTFVVSNDNNALFTVQPAINAAGTLTYTLAPDANGTANVTVRLSDNGGTANGGSDTAAIQAFTIVVTAVDDPPVITDLSFDLRENAVVGQVVGTVPVLDPDLGDAPQFAITSGNTDGTFAIDPATGQITVANAALLSVDPHPTFLLKVTVTDSNNASATATVTIQVVDALVITFGGQVQTYVKTEGTIAIDPAMTARDAQVPDIDYNEGSLTVTINNAVSGDRLGVLTIGNGAGRIGIIHGNIVYQSTLVIIGQIVSGLNGGPLVIRLTSFASEAAIDALLQAISFRNTSSSPPVGMRSITFDLTNRAGDEHDIKTTQLSVVARSVPPTLNLSADAVTYSNLAAPVALDGSATVTDPDSQSLNGGHLTVTVVQGIGRKAKNKLSLFQMGGITLDGKDVLYNGDKFGRLSTKQNSLTVSFSSLFATTEAVQALTRAIAFSTSSGNTNVADRVVQFTLSDGISSQTANKTVHVTGSRR